MKRLDIGVETIKKKIKCIILAIFYGEKDDGILKQKIIIIFNNLLPCQ
jgi:hypothetical protein